MPIIVHVPGDEAEEERFEFDFGDLLFDEVCRLEELTGRNWSDIPTLYHGGNFKVQGYVLLVLMQRKEPGLTIGQLDLRPRKIRFDATLAEKIGFVTRLSRLPELTEEQKAAVEIVRKDLETTQGTPAEVAEDPKA